MFITERWAMGGAVTRTQKRILKYIESFLRANGFPPSIREIGARCGVDAPSSVAYHLRALESHGLLKRTGSVSRGLKPVLPSFRIPILGRVGAGGGMIAEEDLEGHLDPGRDLAGGCDFLLRVRGDSMKAAGIIEGDLVQVRKQDSAKEGDIVVALVKDDNESVVKTLRRSGKRWLLESATPGYAPISKEFLIIGRVVGLVRRY